MKKGIILAAALLLVSGAAFASDLSSVGTSSVEATADYSYTRAIGTPFYAAEHQALVGVQVNEGALGSVAVEAGDTQVVTNYRLNFTTLSVGYANGFNLGALKVVGGVNYDIATSDRWFFSGKNTFAPINAVTGVVELSLPVTKSVRVFADYNHSYGWSQGVSDTVNGAAGGLYVTLPGKIVAKVGYTRDWIPAYHSQGLLTSLSYKF